MPAREASEIALHPCMFDQQRSPSRDENRSRDDRAVPGIAGARRLPRRTVRQGRHRGRVGRPRRDRLEVGGQGCRQSARRRSVRQPRQAARGRQGRHVQCLRVGQLLPRRGHQGRQPPARAPRHRHVCGHRRQAGVAGLYRPATRQPRRRRAVLCRHALSGAASVVRVSCRARRSGWCRRRRARAAASTR